MSCPTSGERRYATISLPLARVKAVGKAQGATVNDVFLTLASTALCKHLLALGDLPDTPLVVNSARPYRRDEHWPFGNRLVPLHPTPATAQCHPPTQLPSITASSRAALR